MAKVNAVQLVNEEGSGYGWDVEVKLEGDETYQDGIDALCAEFGLDYDADADAEFLHNRGSGVWNQLNWTVS